MFTLKSAKPLNGSQTFNNERDLRTSQLHLIYISQVTKLTENIDKISKKFYIDCFHWAEYFLYENNAKIVSMYSKLCQCQVTAQ